MYKDEYSISEENYQRNQSNKINKPMEIKGKIKQIYDKVVVSEKFSRRDFVITTEDKYPQNILIQATNRNCELLDSFNLGEDVTVQINLKGREWNGKFYNTIEAWKITNNEF